MPTEDGWEPSPRIEPGDPLLVWRKVPGADVTLQVRNDHAGTVMLAYAADYNAYVEPLVDRMTACYTPTNSVSTSNHLNATAMDFNWDYYPWKQRGNLNGDKLARLRDLLAYWQGIMFWAGDWDDAYVDEMHHQLDYGSYDLERNGQLGQWIKDHIRPDGFSTYRRGPMPDSPDPVDVLVNATGLGRDKCAQIQPALSAGLRLAQCNTANRIAMFIAQTRHESDNYNTSEEYAKNGRYAPYIGRTWIQITWQSNYAKFGQWAAGLGLISDPNQFVNDPQSLADMQWAGIGAAWFWLSPHDGHNLINDDCDAGDVDAVTYTINGGYNGLDQRTAFWNQALAVGDDLLALTGTPSGDDMAQVPQDQWDRVYQELTKEFPSRSLYRSPGEGLVDTGFGFVLNLDGMTHQQFVERLAALGDTDSLTRIAHVAAGQGADTSEWAISHAKAVLANIEATNPAVLKNFLAQNGTQA